MRASIPTMEPDFSLERALMDDGFNAIAGVDEVGRGPLAGPVTAAAVLLRPEDIPQGLNDSKKLSPKKRSEAFKAIISRAWVCVAHATPQEIDQINILNASHLAMMRAIKGLPPFVDGLLIDGNKIPSDLNLPAWPVIKGDSKSQSIAAASIVAKICRDRIMWDLAQQFPGYGWEKNAGYPSKGHKMALDNLGVTPHHRRSFKPVHNML